MIARSHALVLAKLPKKARAAALAKGVTARRATATARARAMPKGGRFVSTLFKWPGPGGWHFAPVPLRLAPPVTRAWGRTPVEATVDGYTWKTSVWRGKDGRVLLAVPKKVRGTKGDGDKVTVTIRYRE